MLETNSASQFIARGLDPVRETRAADPGMVAGLLGHGLTNWEFHSLTRLGPVMNFRGYAAAALAAGLPIRNGVWAENRSAWCLSSSCMDHPPSPAPSRNQPVISSTPRPSADAVAECRWLRLTPTPNATFVELSQRTDRVVITPPDLQEGRTSPRIAPTLESADVSGLLLTSAQIWACSCGLLRDHLSFGP